MAAFQLKRWRVVRLGRGGRILQSSPVAILYLPKAPPWLIEYTQLASSGSGITSNPSPPFTPCQYALRMPLLTHTYAGPCQLPLSCNPPIT